MSPKFKECLLEVYHAEQTGEIIFESMVKYAKNSDESFILVLCCNLKLKLKQ